MKTITLFAIAAFVGIEQVTAWGAQTHMAIGYIAEAVSRVLEIVKLQLEFDDLKL